MTPQFLASLTEAERAEWDERVAILEYDGGMTRVEAERRAAELIAKGRATSVFIGANWRD